MKKEDVLMLLLWKVYFWLILILRDFTSVFTLWSHFLDLTHFILDFMTFFSPHEGETYLGSEHKL